MQGPHERGHHLAWIESLIGDDPTTDAFAAVDVHASTSNVLPLQANLAQMKSDYPGMSVREQIVRLAVLEDEQGATFTWQWVRGCNHVGGYENAPHWVDRHPCNGWYFCR